MEKLEEYIAMSNRLILLDQRRDIKFKAMDDMWHSKWNLPRQLQLSWMHKVVDNGPYNALSSAARTLATVLPKLTYQPLDNSTDSRDRANEIERVLMWYFKKAARRNSHPIYDTTLSALRYDEIDFQVVYLPWQRKIAEETKGKTWNLSGDYAFITHNPRYVHTLRNDYGVDGVLLCKTMLASDVVALWGKRAAMIQEQVAANELEYVTVYDWTDKDDRIVWAYPTSYPGNNQSAAPGNYQDNYSNHEETESGAAWEIMREPHGLPFIPWISHVGGSGGLDTQPEFQRRPLLDSVYESKLWETLNMVSTLEISNLIATFARPVSKSVTLSGDSPYIDYGVPGGDVALRPGESYDVLPPAGVDNRFVETRSHLTQALGASTIPQILQDPSMTSRISFAAYHALLENASKVLDPAKTLTQSAWGEAFQQMLLWKIHTGDKIMAYDDNQHVKGKLNPTYGRQIAINSDEIDPENIYLTVVLTADVPIDEVARLNAAQIMDKSLDVPKERIYEMLDMENPDQIMGEKMYETIQKTVFQNKIKLMEAEADVAIQKKMGEVKNDLQLEIMQAEQQMQQQNQPPQGAQPSAEGQQPDQGGGMPQDQGGQPQPGQMPPAQGQLQPGQQQQQAMMAASAGMNPQDQSNQAAMQGLQGQSFDPSRGGTPTAMGAPENNAQMVGKKKTKSRKK